jgi:hypothetical protein
MFRRAKARRAGAPPWAASMFRTVSDPTSHLSPALSGRYTIERQLGEGGVVR